jgi:septal ring factor EnvC (AmiA/AmiB activator)
MAGPLKKDAKFKATLQEALDSLDARRKAQEPPKKKKKLFGQRITPEENRTDEPVGPTAEQKKEALAEARGLISARKKTYRGTRAGDDGTKKSGIAFEIDKLRKYLKGMGSKRAKLQQDMEEVKADIERSKRALLMMQKEDDRLAAVEEGARQQLSALDSEVEEV